MWAMIQKILDSQMVTKLAVLVYQWRELVLGTIVCVVNFGIFLCLLSYNPNDNAWLNWSLGFDNHNVTNLGGSFGAFFADVLYSFAGTGAWFLLMILMMEAWCIFYRHLAILPLRLISYGFLWACVGVIAQGVGGFGGVMGDVLLTALSGFLGGNIGAGIFAFIGFVAVFFLLKPYQTQPNPQSPKKAQEFSSTDPLIIPPEPPKKTTTAPPKPRSRPTNSLQAFIKETGLGDKLSAQEPTSTNTATNNDFTAPIGTVADNPKKSGWINAKPKQDYFDHLDNQNLIQPQSINPTDPLQANNEHSPFDEMAKLASEENLHFDNASEQMTKTQNSDEKSVNPTDDASNISITKEDKTQEDLVQDITLQINALSDDQSNNSESISDTSTDVKPSINPPISEKTQSDTADNALADNAFSDMDFIYQEFDEDETTNHSANSVDDMSESQASPPDRFANNQSFAMQTAAYRKQLPPLPSLDLLDEKVAQDVGYSDHELRELAEKLEIKLEEFGVNAIVQDVIQGPIVTSFEVELAAGVKASKVTGIAQDLARSLAMASLRVVEVIPGKPYIGIEIPNRNKETVRLIELLSSDDYQLGEHQIAMAMGKDIGGNVVIADLAKAPHMLVAGTTGSGKSVLVNAMLLSMLFKYTPEELRLILIDPKMLELANYSDIPHLLAPVVTDMTESTSALSWCVEEMERRYQLMSLLKVRKLSEFNKKIAQAQSEGKPLLDPLWQPNDSVSVKTPPELKSLPLIVVVADEFADMMMQVGKEVEKHITRLTQKSRAAGIHLILATQRPSVDVVTGLIKANIPSRVGLRLKSRVDSRTILDTGGAEDMLGHGDMLFIAPGSNETVRVHGAYVSDDEVNRICDAWRERGVPNYVDITTSVAGSGDINGGDKQDLDELYSEVLKFVLETGTTSGSALQRRFKIGYNRAANIIESLEAQGVLSAPDKQGRRTILV